MLSRVFVTTLKTEVSRASQPPKNINRHVLSLQGRDSTDQTSINNLFTQRRESNPARGIQSPTP